MGYSGWRLLDFRLFGMWTASKSLRIWRFTSTTPDGSGINASGWKICRLPNQTTRSWRKKVGNPLNFLRCREVDDLFGLGIGSPFRQFEAQAKSAIFAVPLRSSCRAATGGLGTPSRYRTRSISSPWCEIAARKPGSVSVNLCKAMIYSNLFMVGPWFWGNSV